MYVLSWVFFLEVLVLIKYITKLFSLTWNFEFYTVIFKAGLAYKAWPSCPYKPLSCQTLTHRQFLSKISSLNSKVIWIICLRIWGTYLFSYYFFASTGLIFRSSLTHKLDFTQWIMIIQIQTKAKFVQEGIFFALQLFAW